MTKKKPSPQNRIWEKERRERLNKTFEDLQHLLPDHEPASTLSKVEILQRAIELIGKLQKKIKNLVEECKDPLKEHVKEQEQRLRRLLTRNEELAELLRKAKISVPPCKYTIAEEELQRQHEEKENGNRPKKPAAKQRRAPAPKKQPVISKKPPTVEPVTSAVASETLGLSVVNSIPTMANGVLSIAASSFGTVSVNGHPYAPCPPALRHISAIGAGNNVNVTPALLPTPIMTTSVLISNNGNLVQVPIVAPPSSLLIVGNEDVRAKLNLKRSAAPARYRGKRGKFTIKSINLIPGRIVNGKIPIPPLRRPGTNDKKAVPNMGRKKLHEKCKKRHKPSNETTAKGPELEKRPQLDGEGEGKQMENMQQTLTAVEQPGDKSLSPKELHKSNCIPQTAAHEPEPSTQELEIGLNNADDLSEDIFANLQVPDDSNAHGSTEDGTLSPTAAYLMNFPLVAAGGGKAAGNHVESGEGTEECPQDSAPSEQQEPAPKVDTSAANETGGMGLDNFSSFFNYAHIDSSVVGQDVGCLQPLVCVNTSVATMSTTASSVATAGLSSNFPPIYQSIDNMLDHRPVATSRATNRSLPVEHDFQTGSATFTFTLTSTTCTAPTTVQPSIGSAHFYAPPGGTLNPVKPVSDDFSAPLKPAIEFTFSLTSTTASQPRTVQSQYTNSTILAPTITTPSYDTYGYYHKAVPKANNYCGSFNVVLDPLLNTEKPATSFTFSLTSSTKTDPSYAQSALMTSSTTQAYEATPKLSSKHHHHHHHHNSHQVSVDSSDAFKQETVSKIDKISQQTTTTTTSTTTTTTTRGISSHSGLQQQQQHQHESHQSSQTKYDVPWMAAGTHTGSSNVQAQSVPAQHSNYDLAPAQIMPSIEFPPTAGYSATTSRNSSNYKSDIFFAHPPGEEHNLTMSSPSKLSNILNDSTSPYFPPVTLPNLNGDLALNTSGGVGAACGTTGGLNKPTKSGAQHVKKAYTQNVPSETTSGGSFLSVSQLVNEPSKSYASCQQKPLNNNYSAEALIGNSSSYGSSQNATIGGVENGRKLFDYASNGPPESIPTSTASALTFNFDTYGTTSGMDYNKGYSFVNQQSGSMSNTFGESGFGGSNCAGSNAAIPYYGKATTSAQVYYNQPGSSSTSGTSANYTSSTHAQSLPATGSTVVQDYSSYYLPPFREKTLPPVVSNEASLSSDQTLVKNLKKSLKTAAIVSPVDYVFPTPPVTTVSANSSSYSYSSLAAGANSTLDGTSTQMDPLSYPNYQHPNYHHQTHSQQQQQQQQSRLSNLQYSRVASEAFSVPSSGTSSRKASSSFPNYAQYSSDKAAQHHDAHHQSSYSSNYGSHHLDLSSCGNATPTASYGNLPTTQPSQTDAIYGQTTSYHGHHYRQHQPHHQQHLHHHPQQQQQHHHNHHQQQPSGTTVPVSHSSSSSGTSNTAPGTSGTITNFNLSTICPEINEKRIRPRDSRTAAVGGSTSEAPPTVAPSVASIMTHW
uniref:BHLH domain-containing protein n=1 Tax=Anopheles dirus TaxID=7168 RepID=A0A182NPD1_9DIPT